MTNHEFSRLMSIERFAEMIADYVCESHKLSAECLDCSHYDTTKGRCMAVDNIQKSLESEVEDND